MKRLKQPKLVYGLMLLADVLPVQTDTSLIFQRSSLLLGMVDGAVQKAFAKLKKLKDEEGATGYVNIMTS